MVRITIKRMVLSWLFVLSAVCGPAMDARAASPGREADAPGPLFTTQELARIEQLMNEAVAQARIPSAIAMLARDQEVVWIGTAGEMGPGVPMREDAIMPLASVGKMFTAVAAMILVERGVISLDDPVSKYIPEYARVRVQDTDASGKTELLLPDSPVTIFHLLTHTGGLKVSGDDFWAAWDANVDLTTTHLARALARLPLQSQPGTRFEYGPTGASYEVLGAVIEIASGRTLEEFMQANIFGPLGMNDSCFYLPAVKSMRLPAFYRRVDGVLRVERQQGEDFPRTTFFHGGGGVQSSPRDIHRFARLFLDGGAVDGIRILRPDTVEMMMTDQVGALSPFRSGLGWGFGAAVQPTAAGAAANYYGWVGGGYATLWVDPAHRSIAYFAFPIEPPGDNELLREFRDLVHEVMQSTGESP